MTMTRVGSMDMDEQLSWRVKDRSIHPRFPLVMGIVNATPDSFHTASRTPTINAALALAERMISEGARILDVGGASSRPGAADVPEQVELDRVLPVIRALSGRSPEVLISVDTWRARVAQEALSAGAGMVNDIGAGALDPAMFATVARAGVPYVIMHMQGRPATMQRSPHYADIAAEVTRFLSERLQAARSAGIADVIIDPGFGFGKSTAHNYMLLRELPRLTALGVPVLAGLSRKRMINDVLGIGPEDALNGTSVLNTMALMNGAAILRVHDVKEAVQAVELFNALRAERSAGAHAGAHP